MPTAGYAYALTVAFKRTRVASGREENSKAPSVAQPRHCTPVITITHIQQLQSTVQFNRVSPHCCKRSRNWCSRT